MISLPKILTAMRFETHGLAANTPVILRWAFQNTKAMFVSSSMWRPSEEKPTWTTSKKTIQESIDEFPCISNASRQLVEMYNEHSETAGLRILGFPCNQFGGQEPGSDEEVKKFATEKYNVTFDMFSKINVNGGDAHPLWVYLKEKQGGFLMNAIKWNFTKFVIDKEGQPMARFGPTDDPKPKVEDEVKKYF